MLSSSSLNHLSIKESEIRPAIVELQQGQDLQSSVLRDLLRIEEDFNVYYSIWLKEMEIQREAADKLWHLTQHYLIFMQLDTNCKCPQNYAIESEEMIITKYHYNYQVIMNSNKTLGIAVAEIRPDLLEFRKTCQQLDMKAETPFIMGDTFHKPIQFFIDLVEELFSFFHAGYLKLDCVLRQMDPLELSSVETYQKLLAPCEEFEEYMKHNLSYCRCLCLPPKCRHLLPKARLTDPVEYARRAKKKRCAHRLVRIMKKGIVEDEIDLPITGSHLNPGLATQMARHEQLMSNIFLAFTPSQANRRTLASQIPVQQ
ncbi:uncharacterized protein Dwil_GK15800 [Drosophila willistoni]|uniref:Uncharacterized protein n=2 Tax=Drosophila willistoni TaxID=7260 RepID=B4MRA8_DROWI|nr:uncharacterized protein Dwil_GK15800 [Drosophila willistoni]